MGGPDAEKLAEEKWREQARRVKKWGYWERKLVQPPWKTMRRFPKRLKIELPCDPAIPLLSMYPEKTKALIRKDTCTPIFIAALFTMAKTWMQARCLSTDERIKKM